MVGAAALVPGLPAVVGTVAGLGAIAAIGVGAVSAVTAWRIVRPDRASRPKDWRPRLDPGAVEPVTFAAPGGPLLRGWFIASRSPAAPVVVCLHGFSMNRHEFEDVAPWLIEAGYACLLFDFRGHGESDGDFTTVAAANEVDDARAALAFVRDRLGDEVPVAVYGISMGGAVAIQVAAADPGVRGIVTDCAFATLPRVLDHAFEAWMHLPSALFRWPVSEFARVFTGSRVSEVRPVDVVQGIRPRPYLLVHTVDDRFTDPRDADLIAGAYGPGIERWHPRGDHVQSRFAHPDEYRSRVLSTLARAFAASG